MNEVDFKVDRLETAEDVEDYLTLVRKVWSEEAGVDRLAKKLIDFHAKMTLRDFFVIKDCGRMVSTLNLIPVTWSVGGVLLKVAEMGLVGTLPGYRGKGLIRRLIGEFHADVEDHGYDLAVIEGIPYFYRQFGYDYAVPLLEETKVRLDQIPESRSDIKVRPFSDKDIPKAMTLLERSQRKFCVHSVRDEHVWRMQHETKIASDPEPYEAYAVEEDAELTAYFRVRQNLKDKELILTEITEVDQLSAEAVLSFLKHYGMEQDLEILSSNVSYEEPFAKHLLAFGAVKQVPPYAWQLRITDYTRMFEKLKPLFESRLAASMYHRLSETLCFNFRLFTIRLTIKDGEIVDFRKTSGSERSVIGLNPLVFVQLLTGHKSRQELEEAFPDIRIAASHRHLVDVLFPKLPSYIHSAY